MQDNCLAVAQDRPDEDLTFNPDPIGETGGERKGIGHPDTICDAIAERVTLTILPLLAGRATREYKGERIPVDDIASFK